MENGRSTIADCVAMACLHAVIERIVRNTGLWGPSPAGFRLAGFIRKFTLRTIIPRRCRQEQRQALAKRLFIYGRNKGRKVRRRHGRRIESSIGTARCAESARRRELPVKIAGH